MEKRDRPYDPAISQMLKTAIGQLEAVERMLEDGACCVDVATQIAAAQGLMKKVVSLMVKDSMEKCMQDKGEAEVASAIRQIVEQTNR
ncbi:metal-sensitive transcriptional regulator [Coprothermobacteraceae bacterium]|nr:metal-sensitive transcriptional regulator [Coprothermobacteraceae bacterium]